MDLAAPALVWLAIALHAVALLCAAVFGTYVGDMEHKAAPMRPMAVVGLACAIAGVVLLVAAGKHL